MANLNLTQPEITTLRMAVINKYCKDNNIKDEAFANFKKTLNGTINNYNKICYAITKYLEKQSNIEAYASSVTESEIKTSITKWLAENEKNSKYAFSTSQWITTSVLRRLFFSSQKEFQKKNVKELSFNDHFVLGCYIYSGHDINNVEKVLKTFYSGTGSEPHLRIINGKPETINPYKTNNKIFVLVPLSNGDENARKFEYDGMPVVLNRSNVDPQNNTITSNVHATIYLKEGEWHIKDHSSRKSTYVQVTGEIKITKGTVILLGDKYFLFQ